MSFRLTDSAGNPLVDAFGNYLVWQIAAATGSMSLALTAPTVALAVSSPSITLTTSED